mmetsp:Transcript_94310/g.243581  ORF Transcript_94310/g.243581 Transcript_94310/m.243581 type:complete len:301 (+) Transcript_94310:97-999(+)
MNASCALFGQAQTCTMCAGRSDSLEFRPGSLPISPTSSKAAGHSMKHLEQPEGPASTADALPAAVRAQRCEPALEAICLREELAPCEWCGSCYLCECRSFLEAMFKDAEPRDDYKGMPKESSDSDVPSTTAASEASETSETRSCGSIEDDDAGTGIVAPPDFSGKWTLKGVEGDFEEVMVDAGVSWAVRKMARGANYGAGVVQQNIEQTGSSLLIESKQGPGSTRMIKYDIGVGEQRAIGEDGASIVVTPRWEGQTLVVEGTLETGARIQTFKRYFDGPDMVIETITSKELAAKRIFAKQ